MTTLIDEKEDRASEAGGKRRPGRTRGLERPPTPSPSGGSFVPDLLLGLTVGAVAFVALAVFAFTRPLDRATTGTLDYQHTGQFFYTAQAPEDVYDGGAVHPGDPIFRQVVDQIDVRFRYQLETSQSLAASGTYRIDVELGSPDGWTRTFPMQPETAFDGATFSTIDQLDLATFQAAIDTLEERVGVAQKTYRITIVPQVTLAGLLGGQPLESTFSPRLVFELSELQLRLVGSDADDPLEPTESASISTTGSEPNTVTILKRAFPVATLRQFAIFGVTVTLVALGGVGGATWHRTHDDPAAQNHLRFGNQLVTIEDARALLAEAHVIAVASIEDLAKIAERYGVMMLWHRQPAQDDYYVQTDVGLFHYCLAPRAVRAGVEGGADDVAS